MVQIKKNFINNIVRQALNEDLKPYGDITTKYLKFKNVYSKAKIISKQSGLISGLEFCKKSFKILDNRIVFKAFVRDGNKVKKNTVIAIVKGKTKNILRAERTALNFLSHSSGISTLTHQFVKNVKKKTKICCTRKTTPNLRKLEKYAVKIGGGINHRYNLSDEILIKDNHIVSEKNLRGLVKKTLKSKKTVTVEVESIDQLKEILGLKFRRVLFDNMSVRNLRKCLELCKNKYETEYSGNVNLKNLRKISKTGVNRISVGSITHSAKYFDFSLNLSK